MKLREKCEPEKTYLIEFKESEIRRIIVIFNDYFMSNAYKYTIQECNIMQGFKETLGDT